MREILYKGKTIKERKWIEGSLIIDEKDNYYIGKYIESKGERSYYCTNRRNGKTLNRFIGIGFAMVDKDTVCEYTQLKDKHGNPIWENDIVITQPFYDRPYSDKRKSKQFLGIVEYQTSTFNGNKFYPKQVYQAKWGLKYTEEHGKFVHFSWGDLWGCEVIGNRFDNAELLTAERIGEK